MIALRSAAFAFCHALLTLLMLFAGLPLLVISQRLTVWYVRLWARGVLALLRIFCGTRYEVRGREHLTREPVIFASKHQSAWDIFMLLILLPHPAFVLKRELLWIPIVGWYMQRYGVIAIDRGKGAAALKRMAAEARGALHARRPLVIYPEGTRRAPGAPPKYLPGVALLYGRLMVPVVPVALNSGNYWARNAFIKKPGVIVLEFLPHIPPGLAPKEMLEKLEREVESASMRLTS